VYQAIQKYGVESFVFNVLCGGDENSIKQLEVILIAQLNTKAPHGYNLTDGGEGSIGWKPTIETRKKMSQAHKGRRNGMYGKEHSKETKKKIGLKRQGSKNPTRSKLNKLNRGSKNPRARKVKVQGRIYPCIQDAAKALEIKAGTLRQRFSRYNRSKNWLRGWGYVTN